MQFNIVSLITILVTCQEALASPIEARQNRPQQVIADLNGLKMQSIQTKTAFKDLTFVTVLTEYKGAESKLETAITIAGTAVGNQAGQDAKFTNENNRRAICQGLLSLANTEIELVQTIGTQKENLRFSFNLGRVKEHLRALEYFIDVLALNLLPRAACLNQAEQKFKDLHQEFTKAQEW